MSFSFTYTVKTDQSVPEAVQAVKETLLENGFGTLWELDVPAKLKEKGAEYQGEAVILEVCNPHHAKNALEANMQVIYFLPCKVVVFKDNQGVTSIGMLLPSTMMEALNDPTLKDFALEVEKALQKSIEEVVRQE